MPHDDVYLSTGDVVRVLGVGREMLASWIRQGIFEPEHRGRGTGNNHRYSVRDVLAVKIGRDLRRRGFSVAQAGKAIAWLTGLSIDELDASWADGRRYLLIVGDTLPNPRLLNKDEALAASAVAQEIAGPVPIATIDTEGAYNRLTDVIKLTNLERSKLETRSTEVAECKA